MPRGNRTHDHARNEGAENDPSGSGQPWQKPMQDLGEGIQSGAEHVGNRLREAYDTTRGQAARTFRRAEGVVARHPSSSLLMGFGLGVGVGIVLTTLLTRREETWGGRHLPTSLRELPESVQASFHNLASSIRELPATFARAMPHH